MAITLVSTTPSSQLILMYTNMHWSGSRRCIISQVPDMIVWFVVTRYPTTVCLVPPWPLPELYPLGLLEGHISAFVLSPLRTYSNTVYYIMVSLTLYNHKARLDHVKVTCVGENTMSGVHQRRSVQLPTLYLLGKIYL